MESHNLVLRKARVLSYATQVRSKVIAFIADRNSYKVSAVNYPAVILRKPFFCLFKNLKRNVPYHFRSTAPDVKINRDRTIGRNNLLNFRYLKREFPKYLRKDRNLCIHLRANPLLKLNFNGVFT